MEVIHQEYCNGSIIINQKKHQKPQISLRLLQSKAIKLKFYVLDAIYFAIFNRDSLFKKKPLALPKKHRLSAYFRVSKQKKGLVNIIGC